MPKARVSSSRSTSPSRSPSEDYYLQQLEVEAAERRGLRRAQLIAAIAHVLLLVATFPELAPRSFAAEQEPEKFFVVTPTRFEKKPPPPEHDIPKPRALRVPIPDPNPDDPEPLVADVPEVDFADLELDADRVFEVPDPPPLPPADPGPVRVGGEVEPPVRVHYVEPRYTEIARRAGISGTVILQAKIDRHGQVTDLEVLKGLTFGLTDAATDAVRQWRFEPSVYQGRPVEVLYVLTVHFQLNH